MISMEEVPNVSIPKRDLEEFRPSLQAHHSKYRDVSIPKRDLEEFRLAVEIAEQSGAQGFNP